MCNQCSNEGNPLCETCLAEERLTLECQRLAARVAELEGAVAECRQRLMDRSFVHMHVSDEAAITRATKALGGGR